MSPVVNRRFTLAFSWFAFLSFVFSLSATPTLSKQTPEPRETASMDQIAAIPVASFQDLYTACNNNSDTLLGNREATESTLHCCAVRLNFACLRAKCDQPNQAALANCAPDVFNATFANDNTKWCTELTSLTATKCSSLPEKSKLGLYIGAGLGGVAILALLVILGFVYRKKFGKKEGKSKGKGKFKLGPAINLESAVAVSNVSGVSGVAGSSAAASSAFSSAAPPDSVAPNPFPVRATSKGKRSMRTQMTHERASGNSWAKLTSQEKLTGHPPRAQLKKKQTTPGNLADRPAKPSLSKIREALTM